MTSNMTCVVGRVSGMAPLRNVLYVVCDESSTIKRYTADTLRAIGGDIYVEGMRRPTDIVVCRDDRQLYIADKDYCIWRVSTDDHSKHVKWLPTESKATTFHVDTLSLTSHRLLVTSPESRDLRQYSTVDKRLHRAVHLPRHVKRVYHANETTRQTFVVGHEGTAQNKKQCAVSELFRFCHILTSASLGNKQ